MAITPRTIFTSPAPAAVAAVALFGLTILGTIAFDRLEKPRFPHGDAPCSDVKEMLGAQYTWSESAWIAYANCYERQNQSRRAIEVAARGLYSYPSSEMLYNIKGYHEILLGEYQQAVRTLKTGLTAVGEPTSGTMENNLAWAKLWIHEGASFETRRLYEASLDKEPYVCETLHTGLMVEYELSQNTAGVERAIALKKFQDLRRRYAPCEARSSDWKTLVETSGAAVLFELVDRELGAEEEHNATMYKTAVKLRENYRGASIPALCDEAMPNFATRDACVQIVVDNVHAAQQRANASAYHKPCGGW